MAFCSKDLHPSEREFSTIAHKLEFSPIKGMKLKFLG